MGHLHDKPNIVHKSRVLCPLSILILHLNVADCAPFPLHLLDSVLEIMVLIVLHIHSWDEPRRIREQVIHFLQGSLLRFWLDHPEPDSIREVANHKDNVEPPANILQSYRRDLSDHSVEGERCHRGDGNTFGPSPGVKDFCRHNPGQGTVGCREGEVVEPCNDDEGPGCSIVVCGSWRKLRQQDCCNDEGHHVSQISAYHCPPSSSIVDEHDTAELSDQSDD